MNVKSYEKLRRPIPSNIITILGVIILPLCIAINAAEPGAAALRALISDLFKAVGAISKAAPADSANRVLKGASGSDINASIAALLTSAIVPIS